jgi:hypothetical protein
VAIVRIAAALAVDDVELEEEEHEAEDHQAERTVVVVGGIWWGERVGDRLQSGLGGGWWREERV